MEKSSFTNEEHLVKELRNGSAPAFKHFFKVYHSELCNYLFAISGDSKVSEEIAQQAFVKIWDKREKLFIQENGLKNYFFKTAYHLFIDSRRKTKRQLKLLEQLKHEAYVEVSEIDPGEYEYKLKLLEAEIENLPEQCKNVFIMGKKEGLKYREISERLEISIKTVEVHMSKALKRLRTQLSIFF